jgi:bifunctional NMN adenylyltransferase/nudix hydrolase
MHYDVLAFIGRFQPFHDGHAAVVDQALKSADTVALVIGSHDQPRDTRNPFTTAERIAMITAVYPNEVAAGRIKFVPQYNHAYNDERWIAGVQLGVTALIPHPKASIGLIGHAKDKSSFYLACFPTWESIAVVNVRGLDATKIRARYFGTTEALTDVPAPVLSFLEDFKKTPAFQTVKAEMAFIAKYKTQWATAPYAPTFHTVDAVVVQSGHILLVKRGALPGRGLWALPGGFLNQDETLRDGMLRELKEETCIDVPLGALDRCVRSWRTFDDPNRSARGRTITTAFLIELRMQTKLTKVLGADDAEKAAWVPLANVTRSLMFEDHYGIVQEMVGI